MRIAKKSSPALFRALMMKRGPLPPRSTVTRFAPLSSSPRLITPTVHCEHSKRSNLWVANFGGMADGCDGTCKIRGLLRLFLRDKGTDCGPCKLAGGSCGLAGGSRRSEYGRRRSREGGNQNGRLKTSRRLYSFYPSIQSISDRRVGMQGFCRFRSGGGFRCRGGRLCPAI